MSATIQEILLGTPKPENADLSVADAVWVATAFLHVKSGTDEPFSTEQITSTVRLHELTNGAFKSIWQHVNQHCVANRPPQPNKARILFATGKGDRRLFREGDRYDHGREGGRMHPDWEKLPPRVAHLRTWYETVWNKPSETLPQDPLLALAGTGQGLWGEHGADVHVASLRSGWEDRP